MSCGGCCEDSACPTMRRSVGSAVLPWKKNCVECCCLVQVLWNKQRGPEALSRLLYGTVESGGLGLIPPVDTAKGM